MDLYCVGGVLGEWGFVLGGMFDDAPAVSRSSQALYRVYGGDFHVYRVEDDGCTVLVLEIASERAETGESDFPLVLSLPRVTLQPCMSEQLREAAIRLQERSRPAPASS